MSIFVHHLNNLYQGVLRIVGQELGFLQLMISLLLSHFLIVFFHRFITHRAQIVYFDQLAHQPRLDLRTQEKRVFM